MSFLQIEDPLAAPRPIGIDLGTTHSLVAYVPSVGGATTIMNCDSEVLVPSVVHYRADGSVVVGKEAKGLAQEFPQDTLVSVKRYMGRGADDPKTRKLGPYRFATDTGPVVRFAVAGERTVTPVEVSAEILRELRRWAEDEVGQVGGVVITVPAYFDDAQRQATKDAAKLADLTVLRLLNEPTAAALAYGLQTSSNGLFAVYDLGGGTFDITVLELDNGVFQVRSTGGDSQLGGDDMDRALAEWILDDMGAASEARTPALVRLAIDGARAIKHALTEEKQVELALELPGGGQHLVRVERAQFDALIEPIVQRSLQACKRALRDAEFAVEQIDGVILVGGSTRVPLVRQAVEAFFGREPLAGIDPDQVVAVGAAMQAEMLAGDNDNPEALLLDVLPLSLGIEAMGGVNEKILPRNTPIPSGAAQVFTTYADNQTGFELHVVQGEREMAEDCRSLARFTLKGIPPMAAGLARLQVRFDVDADGLLSVSAQELTTGVEQHVEVAPSYGLSDAEVERMLLEAYDHAEDDMEARKLREQRVEGSRIRDATLAALNVDAELLIAGEAQSIEEALRSLQQAMDDGNAAQIGLRIEDLDRVAKPFAGRRMDRSIRQALGGRAITEVEQETAHARGIESHLGQQEE